VSQVVIAFWQFSLPRFACGCSCGAAICDFPLFRHINERLDAVTFVGADDLRNEVRSILAGISEEEKSRAFDDWINRCK
jgi:hypothetical protein